MMSGRTRKILVIASAAAGVIILAAAVTAAIMFMAGRDRRVLMRAADNLALDIEVKTQETGTTEELAHVADALRYGETYIDFHLNVAGISLSDLVPGIMLPDTEDITFGLDGECERDCVTGRMTASGEASVMNYTLSDIALYVEGSTLYAGIPDLSDHVLKIDSFPDLFPERDGSGFAAFTENEQARSELTAMMRDIAADADITHEKEPVTVTAADGSEYPCVIYHLIPDAEQIGKMADYVNRNIAGSRFTLNTEELRGIDLYIDDDRNIRQIESVGTAGIADAEYGFTIRLTGADNVLDDIELEAGEEPGGTRIRLKADRTPDGYDMVYTCDDTRIKAVIYPEYDRDRDRLYVEYGRAVMTVGEDEIFRSSGSFSITPADVDISNTLDGEVTSDPEVIAEDILTDFAGGFGRLGDMFGIGDLFE